jgi:3-dehydroquinate synthase/2-deoxy-scyllo-inosose synthase
MKEVSFVFADRATVPTFIGMNMRDEVIKHILDVKPDKLLLVCDQASEQLHGDYFGALRPVYDAPGEPSPKRTKLTDMPVLEKIVMPGGDACKSWHHLTSLMEWAFSIGATKKSLVVGFGGGALMNLTGLFASTLYRGTKLMYVPTTFLAMHDVTTSLKTSVCFDGRKNNIGSFYAPLKIFIDASFCKTLSISELFSGMGELAKNAALFGGKHAEGFCAALSKDQVNGDEFVKNEETLMSLLHLGIDAKMSVLKKDAMERTDGMVFEYGHTVSHAIEKAYGDGVVPHGVGVTYGMLSSSYAAEKLGIMTADDRKVHDDLCWKLLGRWPLPEPKPTVERVMALAMKDSKRGITDEADDEISDVLLRKLGDIVTTKTQNLSKFPCRLVKEWLVDMGFPAAAECDAMEAELHGPVTESDCDAMIKTIGCSTERELGALGYESLTIGFANVVYAVTRRGYPLVVKALMELSSMRLERGTIGQADMHAGRFGIGPKVYYAGKAGLVMDRLSGRTLSESDVHKGDFRLLGAIADLLARCHQLPPPQVFRQGVPLLWREIDKMMDVAARRPELIPKDMPDVDVITSEINAMKVALEKYQPKVVFSHGSMNPSNVMLNSDGTVKLIDFELGGPNYRGFDLMKLFRTSGTCSERCLEYFLRVYGASTGELQCKDDVSTLVKEVRMFEPLTWLEAAVFFLVMPQFKPEGSSKWNELAIHRWSKFKETKSLLV